MDYAPLPDRPAIVSYAPVPGEPWAKKVLTPKFLPNGTPDTPFNRVLARVERGETVTVYAGTPKPSDAPRGSVALPNGIPGEPPGVYRCRLLDGRPVMEVYTAAPEVPATARPFAPGVFPSDTTAPANSPTAAPAPVMKPFGPALGTLPVGIPILAGFVGPPGGISEPPCST